MNMLRMALPRYFPWKTSVLTGLYTSIGSRPWTAQQIAPWVEMICHIKLNRSFHETNSGTSRWSLFPFHRFILTTPVQAYWSVSGNEVFSVIMISRLLRFNLEALNLSLEAFVMSFLKCILCFLALWIWCAEKGPLISSEWLSYSWANSDRILE